MKICLSHTSCNPENNKGAKIKRYLIRAMIIACVGLRPLLGCSSEEETLKVPDGCAILGKPADFTENAPSDANARFGFKLLTELYNQKPDNNVFISPLSISIALTMTYNGTVGETMDIAVAG